MPTIAAPPSVRASATTPPKAHTHTVGVICVMPACMGPEQCTIPLNALSVGVHAAAASGAGVQNPEICDAMANLDTTPGKSAHTTVINKVVEDCAGLKEQGEFARGLSDEAEEIVVHKVNNTRVDEFEYKLESDNTKGSDGAGGGRRRGHHRSRNCLRFMAL